MSAKDMGNMIRRLQDRSQTAQEGMDDYMERQARGEKSDGAEFLALVQKRVTADQALQAQLRLDEKPIKTVLTEIH